MNYYAGIGARTPPLEILELMEQVAQVYAKAGWVLRTGNCEGSDQAFQRGANSVNPKLVELYLPWSSYNKEVVVPGNKIPTDQLNADAFMLAGKLHPAWENCNGTARRFHTRNIQIVLGEKVKTPVDVVICWTYQGQEIGGTAQGLRAARYANIPVINLGNKEAFSAIKALVETGVPAV